MNELLNRLRVLSGLEPLVESVEPEHEHASGRCRGCGAELYVPVVAGPEGSIIQPGFECDICDGVDTFMDSDDWNDMKNERDYQERQQAELRHRPIAVPTRNSEDRMGSGYESRSDDTRERDGSDYDAHYESADVERIVNLIMEK